MLYLPVGFFGNGLFSAGVYWGVLRETGGVRLGIGEGVTRREMRVWILAMLVRGEVGRKSRRPLPAVTPGTFFPSPNFEADHRARLRSNLRLMTFMNLLPSSHLPPTRVSNPRHRTHAETTIEQASFRIRLILFLPFECHPPSSSQAGTLTPQPPLFVSNKKLPRQNPSPEAVPPHHSSSSTHVRLPSHS